MIKWIKEPTVALKKKSPYNRVIVIEAGKVSLDGSIIEFPVGWETDVTTTPRLLFPLLPQLGAHNPASILHDRLLDLSYPRVIARWWMCQQLDALEEVSKFRKLVMWGGVWLKDMTKRL